MKNKILLAFTLVLACSFAVSPNAYVISQLDIARGTIKAKLEKATATYQKPKGKTSTTKEYLIPVAKSPVRIKLFDAYFQSVDDNPNNFLNASDFVNLYKLTSDRSGRSFILNADGITSDALIPLNFTHSEANRMTMKISPAAVLAPGEYAFVDRSTITAEGNVTVWTFGID